MSDTTSSRSNATTSFRDVVQQSTGLLGGDMRVVLNSGRTSPAS
jgi:hypothetical protein